MCLMRGRVGGSELSSDEREQQGMPRFAVCSCHLGYLLGVQGAIGDGCHVDGAGTREPGVAGGEGGSTLSAFR